MYISVLFILLFYTFILRKLTELCSLVTYSWNIPCICTISIETDFKVDLLYL